MDPAAHTLTGAALAAAGLRRTTPLATAALLMGANAPDVDIVSGLAGPYATLAFRRGWTHGILALVLWPFVITAALLLWDRWRRRRSHLAGARAGSSSPHPRVGPLLGVAALAVASHATLDWLNNYGIRLLMPFDARWFYGDALFIIDPWVWLVLGGAVFLAYSRRRAAIAAWCAWWLAASLLVLLAPQVPAVARGVWIAGLVAMAAARVNGRGRRSQAPLPARASHASELRGEAAARLALAVIGTYMAAQVLANVPARVEVSDAVAQRGLGPVEKVMIGPVAADPFRGTVVVQTPDAYLLGRWSWLSRPRFTLEDRKLPKLASGPVVDAAAATPAARRFLTWSRFPYAEIDTTPEGFAVRFADARYVGTGQLAGPTVHLDRAMHPVDESR